MSCLLPGCVDPPPDEALAAELRALRSLAWDARRHATRAEVFAEAAEHSAVQADGADAGDVAAVSPSPAARGAWEKAHRIRVRKQARQLELLRDGEVIRRFRIALGSEPVGAKRRRGDGRTPEGIYLVDLRRETRRYGPGLRISYPSASDRRRARQAGVAPGGGIFIHGLPRGLGLIGADHAKWDWTNGCIAVTDEELAELWERVDDGTEIEILP